MKFNTTLIGIAYIMMLMGAHVLAAKEKVGLSRICESEINGSFNYWNFFLAATLTAIGGFAGDLIKDVRSAMSSIKSALGMPDTCSETMSRRFNEEMEKRVEDIELLAAQVNAKTDAFIKTLRNLKSDELKQIEANKDKPRALCELALGISKSLKTDGETTQEHIKQMVKFIDRALNDNWDYEKFRRKATSVFTFHSYDRTYVMDLVGTSPLTTAQLQKRLLEIKSSIFAESSEQVNLNLQDIPDEKPNCSILPKAAEEFSQCKKVGWILKIKVYWQLIQPSQNTDMCVTKYVTKSILQELAAFALDIVVTIVADLMGLFMFRIVKIVYLSIKLIYNIYRALRETNVDELSTRWGKALGYVIRIILDVLVKRNKLNRLRK